MTNVEEFYNWLFDQEYWVDSQEAHEKAEECGVHFPKMIGITMKPDGDGNTLVPRRDYRRFVEPKDGDM